MGRPPAELFPGQARHQVRIVAGRPDPRRGARFGAARRQNARMAAVPVGQLGERLDLHAARVALVPVEGRALGLRGDVLVAVALLRGLARIDRGGVLHHVAADSARVADLAAIRPAQAIHQGREGVHHVAVEGTAREGEPAGDRERPIGPEAQLVRRDLHRRREAAVEIDGPQLVGLDAGECESAASCRPEGRLVVEARTDAHRRGGMHVGRGPGEDPAVFRDAVAARRFDGTHDHRGAEVDHHVRDQELRVREGDPAIRLARRRDRLGAHGFADPGVGVVGGHPGEAGPEPTHACAVIRERLAPRGAQGVLVEGEDRRRHAPVALFPGRPARVRVEGLVGPGVGLLGPRQFDARLLRPPLRVLGLGSDEQHAVALPRLDLDGRVGQHALDRRAGDRPGRRLRAGAAKALAEQRRRVRVGPQALRDPDRIELAEQVGSAGIFGGALRRLHHQGQGLAGIGGIIAALLRLAAADEHGGTGVQEASSVEKGRREQEGSAAGPRARQNDSGHGPAPGHPGPVDLLERLLDPLLPAVVVDGPRAGRKPVVIDDAPAPYRETRVEVFQGLSGRLVEVAVQPQHRDAPAGEARQGVGEPARDEHDLVVPEIEGAEVRFDLRFGHSEESLLVVAIAGVGGIALRVGGRQAREGIRQHHATIRDPVSGEHAPHEDAGAPAPDARLDEVTRDALGQHLLDAAAQVLHPVDPDHAVGLQRPFASGAAGVGFEPLEDAPTQARERALGDPHGETAEWPPLVVARRERQARLVPERVTQGELQELEVAVPVLDGEPRIRRVVHEAGSRASRSAERRTFPLRRAGVW